MIHLSEQLTEHGIYVVHLKIVKQEILAAAQGIKKMLKTCYVRNIE